MSERVPVRRPHAVCEARFPRCPRCGRVLHGVHAGDGLVFAHCRAKAPRRPGAPLSGDRCGQHAAIIGAPGGVCVVIPISRVEFERYTEARTLPSAREICLDLGVILPAPES